MVSSDLPNHIAPEQVFAFDYLNFCRSDTDPFVMLKQLHDGPDIFWTPRHGGHWVAVRGADIRAILNDHQQFSSCSVFIPRGSRPPIAPLELDPPEHEAFRALLAPLFTPKAISYWTMEARSLAVSLIKNLHSRGNCEFMTEFALQMPIQIFMQMCGLPLNDQELLLKWSAHMVRPANVFEMQRGRMAMAEYIRNKVAELRSHPKMDLLSTIVNSTINGRNLSDSEAYSLAYGILGGGLDTVASSMSWIIYFLANSPTHRQQLTQNPELIPRAIHEFIRRFSVANTARVLTKDLIYKDAHMKKGEQIYLSPSLYGLDDDIFERPLEINFKRKNSTNHLAFSDGPHRCPGLSLALQELRIFLEEWLTRIPDFWISNQKAVEIAGGVVHGFRKLPLAWNIKS